MPPSSTEFGAENSAQPGSGAGSDEPARTPERRRLVWCPRLHKMLVDAVSHLGIKNAVPKTVWQLMSVDGLTREQVASHLQKYRLYLKRKKWLPGGAGGGDDDDNGGGGDGDDNGGGDDGDNNGGGGDDGDNGSGGDGNGNDKDEGSGSGSGNNGNLKRKQMKPMFGCKFGYHAGNENWSPVGQLQCVKRVKYGLVQG